MTLLDQGILINLIFFLQPWKLKSCKAKMLEQNGSSQTKFTVAVVRPKGFPGWIWFALFFHQDKCFVLLIDAKISRASNHLFN